VQRIDSDPLTRCDLRNRVQAALTEFASEQEAQWSGVPDPVGPALSAAARFVLEGGKRLRPAFCYWGWRGAGGSDTEDIIGTAAALEWLHACALIHDDVMDGSWLRRGRPSVHCEFAAVHEAARWSGDAASFGRSAAILLGDLCLLWGDQMYCTAGMSELALARARARYDEMRVEPVLGQYLDLADQSRGSSSLDRAREVARYKSGKYTVERPLQLGGALAGGDSALLEGFSAYGGPLGEAFQLRDDVLGVFGDPTVTGKPVGDDLRDGKRTPLLLLSRERATPRERSLLDRSLGDRELSDETIHAIQTVVVDSGGLAAAEELIEQLTARSVGALTGLPVDVETHEFLQDIATVNMDRRR
jgi:geranylgeranyl diphosphate synthase, type I